MYLMQVSQKYAASVVSTIRITVTASIYISQQIVSVRHTFTVISVIYLRNDVSLTTAQLSTP